MQRFGIVRLIKIWHCRTGSRVLENEILSLSLLPVGLGAPMGVGDARSQNAGVYGEMASIGELILMIPHIFS
jgi:hypothetical protein